MQHQKVINETFYSIFALQNKVEAQDGNVEQPGGKIEQWKD